MSKTLLLLFLCLPLVALTQPQSDTAYNTTCPQITYSLLADSGYSLQYVLTNKLHFTTGGIIKSAEVPVYWLKITIANPLRFGGQYKLAVEPNIYNTFYYYDANMQQWLTQNVGIKAAESTEYFNASGLHLPMQPQAANTVYVKMDIAALKNAGFAKKPVIEFEKQTVVDRRLENLRLGWAVAVGVLFFFFLSNLYVYFWFGGRLVFNYLIAQASSIIYITTYREMLPFKVFTTAVQPDGSISFYSLNNLLMHAAILLIIHGFVQLTRVYLNTKSNLPRMDAVLKYGLYFYWLASVVLMVINVSWFLADDNTVLYDNIYLFLLISAIIYTCVLAYKRHVRASGAFLAANVIPLVIMTAITLVHVFVTTQEEDNWWLPNLALVSTAFVFSIALVARTKLVQNDLKAKEMEAQQLAFELKEIGLLHSMMELETQAITSDILREKTRNELLQQTLEANQRELASTTMYMVQKNQLLATLKGEIEELSNYTPGKKHQELAGIKSILQTNLYLDDDWGKFKLHFEQVHPRFFEELSTKHPSLTKNEIRLHAYFHINLSTKEIASMLNIAPASVYQAKMRLNKKMGHPPAGPENNLPES